MSPTTIFLYFVFVLFSRHLFLIVVNGVKRHHSDTFLKSSDQTSISVCSKRHNNKLKHPSFRVYRPNYSVDKCELHHSSVQLLKRMALSPHLKFPICIFYVFFKFCSMCNHWWKELLTYYLHNCTGKDDLQRHRSFKNR